VHDGNELEIRIRDFSRVSLRAWRIECGKNAPRPFNSAESCGRRISGVRQEWPANSFATVLHTLTNRPNNENNFRPWPYRALAGP